MRRGYEQTVRAQQTAEREERLLTEAERLFAGEPFARVTLAAVAEAAGVTIPTVQRRFGNKEGLFAAVAERLRARVAAQRGAPPVADRRACVAQLVAHYELEGRLVWHLLRQEDDVPLLAEALPEARRLHRAWVERVWAEAIARRRTPAARRRVTDALVAATDLFVWKLLRVDLGRGAAEVEATMAAMAEAVAEGEG